MSSKLQFAVKAILAGTALSLISTGTLAAGAVGIAGTSYWVGGNNVLGVSSQIQTLGTNSINSNNSWTDNSADLANSAWGHTGKWLTFDVTKTSPTVDINAKVLTGNFNIAFTVWASGATPFNGGTADFDQTSLVTSGNNAAHDFNQVGQVGSYGTRWATDPSIVAGGGGNLLDTLAYANSGVAHTDPSQNDYSQVINYGVNQVATDNVYFSAVAGTVGANYADIQFQNLATGWYTIFVGGANSAETLASTYQISISAVPVPGAVYLFGSAIAGLLATGRRKQKIV